MNQEEVSPADSGRVARTLVYFGLLAATVAAFLVVRHFGEQMTAPATGRDVHAVARDSGATSDTLVHVLVALTAVILVGRVLGVLFRYIGQPPVIGEVVAGILLGPSFLGAVAPAVSQFILPASVAPLLGVIAQLGVILYMFSVGLELDLGRLHGRGGAVIAISHVSIVVPFTLGSILALALYPILSSRDIPFTSFALFLGVAMSVTAFPVLARILSDRGLARTPLGTTALTCAAADDVSAWCLLAFVVGVAQSQLSGALWVIALTILYMTLMFVLVRPALTRYAPRFLDAEPSQTTLAFLFAALLTSSLITEGIGVHAIFGAFLFGAVIPHDSRLAQRIVSTLQDLVAVLLLPAFFAFTGMRTRIALVSGWEGWLICGVIILVATVGKFGGTLAAARITGMGWREAASLGVLMNTRGLMELIVLNIGLDLRVISPTLFAMMVLMALATTMATAPLLRWLWPDEPAAESDARTQDRR